MDFKEGDFILSIEEKTLSKFDKNSSPIYPPSTLPNIHGNKDSVFNICTNLSDEKGKKDEKETKSLPKPLQSMLDEPIVRKPDDSKRIVLPIKPMSNDEIEFLRKQGIYDDKNLRYRWDWVLKYPHLTVDFFREVIYPKLGENLNIKKVRDPPSKGGLGFSAFLKQIKKLGMTYTDLVDKAGFKKDFLNFVKVIVNFIKKLIRIEHNNFKDYTMDLKLEGINNIKILKVILTNFDNLFKIAKLKDGKRNRITAKKCLLVISFALLKCQNYNCIFESLTNYSQSKTSIWKAVYDFIPFLKQINPNADIDIWLPPKMLSLTYNDCKILADRRDDIEFDMTKNEFDESMKNRGKTYPSDVKLNWKCNKSHKLNPSYRQLKNSDSKCPHCYGNAPISYNDCIILSDKRDDVEFDMTKNEFDEAMKNRGKTIPSGVKLKWICEKNSHHFLSNYKNIKQNHGCPYCSKRAKAIGLLIHPILEYYCLLLFNLRNCHIEYEYFVSSTRKFQTDLKISRNDNFKDNIEVLQRIVVFSFQIEGISIDFTLSVRPVVFLNKCYKEYHSKTQFLMIVSILKDNNDLLPILNQIIQDKKNISFKENIKVLSLEQFLEFLGLTGKIKSLSKEKVKILSNINEYVDLANEALSSDKKLNKLVELEKDYRELLKNFN
ncbi:MAG: hypothetical protein K940chlam5_01554 [Candidatus Anoxychlamydiales bacterium]|nr:hypothetical protein [Candidatus Anoxychlamydiales bacterium]